MRSRSEARLQRGQVGLRYLEWPAEGAREPAILLLHGLSSNAAYWQRLAELLPGRRLVALDQRGHGRSDRPPTGYANESVVADAAHLIEEASLGRPLVVGHSWGATIALELAGTRSQLVSGLAFIDGPALPMNERLTWEEVSSMMQPALPRYSTLEEAADATREYLQTGWGQDLMPFVADGLVREGDAYVSTLTAEVRVEILRGLYLARPDLLWSGIRGPILLGFAARGPEPFIELKRRSVEAVSAQVPDARVRWFESQHDIPLHLPGQLASEIEVLAMRSAWRLLAGEITALEGDWNAPSGYEDWSAKDLLAHISSTQASMAAVVRSGGQAAAASSAGQPPFDADRWNASQIRRRRELSPDSLLEEVRTGTAELETALQESDLEGGVAMGPYGGRPAREVMDQMLRHQQQHLDQLRGSLRREDRC